MASTDLISDQVTARHMLQAPWLVTGSANRVTRRAQSLRAKIAVEKMPNREVWKSSKRQQNGAAQGQVFNDVMQSISICTAIYKQKKKNQIESTHNPVSISMSKYYTA